MKTTRIVVLDGHTLNPGDNPWDPVEELGELTVYDRTPPDLVVDRALPAEVVLTNKTRLPGSVLERLPQCRFISVLATGYDVVDLAAAQKKGVPVSNVPVYGTDSVAQFVLALLLNLIHRPALHDQMVRDGEWRRRGDFSFWVTRLMELTGKKMGIVGYGRIGRRVGEVAHAMGMQVMAHDVVKTSPPDFQPFSWNSLEEIFSQADAVTLHCPLTADNVGLVNRRLLQLMQPTAFLINTARGPLVNPDDLIDALDQGMLAGASLDVAPTEPIPDDSPLLRAKNLVLTPHMAWATQDARKRLMRTTADNIAAFLAGQPINVVN